MNLPKKQKNIGLEFARFRLISLRLSSVEQQRDRRVCFSVLGANAQPPFPLGFFCWIDCYPVTVLYIWAVEHIDKKKHYA